MLIKENESLYYNVIDRNLIIQREREKNRMGMKIREKRKGKGIITKKDRRWGYYIRLSDSRTRSFEIKASGN